MLLTKKPGPGASFVAHYDLDSARLTVYQCYAQPFTYDQLDYAARWIFTGVPLMVFYGFPTGNTAQAYFYRSVLGHFAVMDFRPPSDPPKFIPLSQRKSEPEDLETKAAMAELQAKLPPPKRRKARPDGETIV